MLIRSSVPPLAAPLHPRNSPPAAAPDLTRRPSAGGRPARSTVGLLTLAILAMAAAVLPFSSAAWSRACPASFEATLASLPSSARRAFAFSALASFALRVRATPDHRLM